MEEVFVRQADGRLVSGPSLPESEISPKRPFKTFAFIIGWFATVILSFTFGLDFPDFSAATSLHDQVVARLQEGCVFQFKGISTTAAGQAELEQQAEEAKTILEGQVNAKNIRWTSVEAQEGVKRMDPTATRLVVVSWEVCK